MMHQAAQQHAIEASAFERQVFGVAFDQLKAGIFAATELYQFGADIEPNTLKSLLPEQIRKHTRTTTEIGDPRAARQSAQPNESRDDPLVRLRREDVIGIVLRMRIEERDFFALVLRLIGSHRRAPRARAARAGA